MGGRGTASTILVFYFYAAQKNIMWADTISLHTFYCKKCWLPWYTSDPRFVGTHEIGFILRLEYRSFYTHTHARKGLHARMHARTQTGTHANTHTHARTRTHAHTHAFGCTHTYSHVHTHTHVRTRTHARTPAHMRTRTHAHTHTRTHAHTHTRTHAHWYPSTPTFLEVPKHSILST